MSACPGFFAIDQQCAFIQQSAVVISWEWQEDDGTPIDLSGVDDIQMVIDWRDDTQTVWSLSGGQFAWVDQSLGQYSLSLGSADLPIQNSGSGYYAIWFHTGINKSVNQEGPIELRNLPVNP